MPQVPHPSLDAGPAPRPAGPSPWVTVLLFGLACGNAGMWLSTLANALDAGRPLRWLDLASAAFMLTSAVVLGVWLRRRLRETVR